MAFLGWPFGTPSLVYSVLRSAHLTITVVGQICLPEVANGLTSQPVHCRIPATRQGHTLDPEGSAYCRCRISP